jgi:hypothetical protein
MRSAIKCTRTRASAAAQPKKTTLRARSGRPRYLSASHIRLRATIPGGDVRRDGEVFLRNDPWRAGILGLRRAPSARR